MTAEAHPALAFHLTGTRPDGDASDPASLALCPALLRNFLDLRELRYDYPLVLVDTEGEAAIDSLCEIVNRVLRSIAPRGLDGERVRRNVLAVESAIRDLVSTRQDLLLSAAFDEAADRQLARPDRSAEDRELLLKDIVRARRELGADGRLVGCGAEATRAVVEHIFRRVERQRSRAAFLQIERAIHRLRGLLRCDDLRSRDGRGPTALRNAVGTSFESELDFDKLAEYLPSTKAESRLPRERRRRIESALAVLEGQRFFSPDGEGAYDFECTSCREALDRHDQRLPAMVDLARAIRVAELELDNAYCAEIHDPYLASFDRSSLNSQDASLFPAYLVDVDGDGIGPEEKAALIGALSSNLPFKILVHTNDVFREPRIGDDGDFGAWNLGLARMASGLGSAFVVQTTSSHVYAVRDGIAEGMTRRGPALFRTAAGAAPGHSSISPYLVSASATESRAFPTFIYDPAAGEELSGHFELDANPQPERVWPVSELSYEDCDRQRVVDDLEFTVVDYLAADSRYARHFMALPAGDWDASMVPLAEYLGGEDADTTGRVPYIWMVDRNEVLQRVVVARGLLEAAKRCERDWRSLQELAGVRTDRVRRLIEEAQREWEKQSMGQGEIAPNGADESPTSLDSAAVAAKAAGNDRSPDEPFIETVRCSTCDECVNRNNKMFRYNQNKQAYIEDLNAGTYRQMVEAAEACKLALIHPGKPWNPDEPDLDELMRRAAPFI